MSDAPSHPKNMKKRLKHPTHPTQSRRAPDVRSKHKGKTATSSKNVRRMRSGVMSAIVVVATIATVVVANLIAARFSTRIDVTQTGEHKLSDRTVALLDRLSDTAQPSEGYELVLAIDPHARTPTGSPMVHPRALQTVRGIAREMHRQASDLTITHIDVGRAQGEDTFQKLLDRLLDRDADALDAQVRTVRDAADRLESLADFFAKPVADRLIAIASELDPENPELKDKRDTLIALPDTFNRYSAVYRVGAERAKTDLPESFDGAWPLPPVDETLAELAPSIDTAMGDLDQVIKAFVSRSTDESLPSAAQRKLGELADVLVIHRDELAKHADTLSKLRAIPLLSVGRMIQSQQAVLLIGPPDRGLVAIDFDTLFPPSEVIEAAGGVSVDLRLRSEELLSSALGTLVDPIKPIVVLVHCDDVPALVHQEMISLAVGRLRSRSMDVLEWAVMLEDHPPTTANIDPQQLRPVVYVVQSSFSPAQPGSTGTSPQERFKKLGDAVARLVRDGESFMLNIQPSQQPLLGGEDPLVKVMPLFGLTADSAKPIMVARMTAEGRDVLTEHLVRTAERAGSETPPGAIAGALHGLDTFLSWPVPLRTVKHLDADRIQSFPLLRVSTDGAWAESMWAGYFRVPHNLRSTMTDKPTPGDPSDDTHAPFLVGAAVDRTIGSTGGSTGQTQRAVFIGSAGWFMDPILGRTMLVDGREIAAFAGNAELLEASVLWLAHQDDRIAQSPAARTTPRIRALEGKQLTAIRWLVLAGLPLLVLVCGLAWRLIRG